MKNGKWKPKTIKHYSKSRCTRYSSSIKTIAWKLSNDEVKVKVIHAVAGAVTESDVQLAKAGKCIIIAFNVRPVNTAKDMAEKKE